MNTPAARTYTYSNKPASRAARPESVQNKQVVKAQMPAGLTVLRGVYPGAGSYQFWGPSNNYPQIMLEAINGSSTGAACVDTKAKYIAGNGFLDTTFYQAVVNRQGLQVDSLLDLQSKDLAALYGFCMLLNINGNGHPCEVFHAPFSQWRPAYADADGVVRWDFIIQVQGQLVQSDQLNNKGPIKYYRYNPKEKPADRAARIRAWCEAEKKSYAEYPGELYVFFHKRSGALNHPRPLHDACLRDMMTEATLKISRHVDIRQGFAAQAQVTEYGNPKPSKEKLAADTLKYGEFIGEDATRLLVQYAAEKSMKPDVDIFTVNEASKRYLQDEGALRYNIRAMFLLPSILYGEAQAGALGLNQMFRDAVDYANRVVVNTDQRALELGYTSIFSQFVPVPLEGQLPIAPGQFNPSSDYTIQPLDLDATDEAEPTEDEKLLAKIAALPPGLAALAWAALTVEEQRRLLGKMTAPAPAPVPTTNPAAI